VVSVVFCSVLDRPHRQLPSPDYPVYKTITLSFNQKTFRTDT
jgi:hypothetical protein